MSQKFFSHFFEIRHKNHPPFFTKGIPQYPEHLLFFYLLFITRDLWIPVSTRTRYAWSCLAGFSNELCTRVYRNYGDLRRLPCTTTAPTIHRTSPFTGISQIGGPRRSLYSRTTSVIFVTRSQCTDHCLRTTPMLTIASSLPMS